MSEQSSDTMSGKDYVARQEFGWFEKEFAGKLHVYSFNNEELQCLIHAMRGRSDPTSVALLERFEDVW